MDVCVCKCVCVWPSAPSIAISAAAAVIVPQWLQCREKKHYLIILQSERWREDRAGQYERIQEKVTVFRPLATWVLCYCVITDLHQLIAGWKSSVTVAM